MALTKNEYYKETLSGLSFSKETITGRLFDECLFDNCSFIECKFDRCRFLNCRFDKCNLSAVVPSNSRFSEVKFSDSKVIGFDWTKAANIERLEFKGCQINYSSFKLLKLPGIKIINCEAKEVAFIETDLSKGDFINTDFENSRFFKTNLSRANFKGARNYSIDVHNNTLTKAQFSLPEVLSLLSSLDIIIE